LTREAIMINPIEGDSNELLGRGKGVRLTPVRLSSLPKKVEERKTSAKGNTRGKETGEAGVGIKGGGKVESGFR